MGRATISARWGVAGRTQKSPAGRAWWPAAQAVRRLGGEVVLLDGSDHVVAREPAPLGEALGAVLRRDGIELFLGTHATAARRAGDDYVLELDDGRELRGDRLLVAAGRRPRVDDIGLETLGGSSRTDTASPSTRTFAPASGCGPQATSPASGRSPTSASTRPRRRGEHPGEDREAHYEAVPRVTYTDPQAAAVGATGRAVQRNRARIRAREDRHVHTRVRGVLLGDLPHGPQEAPREVTAQQQPVRA